MKVYIVNYYDEDGPQKIKASLNHRGAYNAFIALLEEYESEDRRKFIREGGPKLNELLSEDESGSYNLTSGWGGLQLHILETIDDDSK